MKSCYPRRSGALRALQAGSDACLGSAAPAGSPFPPGTSDQVNELTLRLPRNRSHQITRHRSRRRDTPCQQLPRLAAAA